MYSRKRSLRDCVIKLRDNRIFKALLSIKKSFKSIYFHLAKRASVSHPPTLALVELILINQGVIKKLFTYSQYLLCSRICLTLQRHSTLQLI